MSILGMDLETQTDAQGQSTLEPAPVSQIELQAHGGAAVSSPDIDKEAH